jgi:hypothetical protein
VPIDRAMKGVTVAILILAVAVAGVGVTMAVIASGHQTPHHKSPYAVPACGGTFAGQPGIAC